MRRSASEIILNLEMRIARLERQASNRDRYDRTFRSKIPQVMNISIDPKNPSMSPTSPFGRNMTEFPYRRDFIKKWNRSANYRDLEKAGLADAYDELYSLTVKEEERGELSSRENKRYVDLYEMLTKHNVEIRFGVNI